jgi:hypothetical protein
MDLTEHEHYLLRYSRTVSEESYVDLKTFILEHHRLPAEKGTDGYKLKLADPERILFNVFKNLNSSRSLPVDRQLVQLLVDLV